MADSNHPFVQKIFDSVGVTSEDRDLAYRQIEVEAALYSPAERVALLEALGKAIEDDESNRDDRGNPKPIGSLRERAQLLNMQRHLSASHQKLKFAGR